MGEERGRAPELWLFPTGFGGRSDAKSWRTRRLTAGDKDSDPRWSPDGPLHRVHRQAQGRRRAAGPSVLIAAGRRRAVQRASRRCRPARPRSSGFQTASASPSSRRCGATSTSEAAQARRMKERKGREGQGARHRARRVPLLGPLAFTDGRELARVRGRCRRRSRARPSRRHRRLALPPWEPGSHEHYDIAPRRPPDRAHRRSRGQSPGMMNRC